MTIKDINSKAKESLNKNFKDAEYKADDKSGFDSAATANEVETLKEDRMAKDESLKVERTELEDAAKAKLNATNKDAQYKADDKSEFDSAATSNRVETLKEDRMAKDESLKVERTELEDEAKAKLDATNKDASYKKEDNSFEKFEENTKHFLKDLNDKIKR